MDFGEILSKAWKIIWKYKILWVFGILASLGQGGGGGGGGSGSNFSSSGNGTNFNYDWNNLPNNLSPNTQQLLDKVSGAEVGIIVLIVLGLLLLGLIFWALSVVGKTGLVIGTQKADNGIDSLSFGEIWSGSMRYFWRVLLFGLVTGLAIFIIMLIMMLPMILAIVGTMGIGLICVLPFLCLLIPAMLLLNIILEQGTIAIVVEDLGIIDAFKRGWQVFRQNIWNLILMAIILGVMSGVINFVISLPLILAILPGLIGVFASASSGSFDTSAMATGGLISLGLCCLIFPIYLVLNGVLTAYVQSAWTLTFMRLTNKPAAPVFAQPEIPASEPPQPQQM
jgi:hypothetical protein